MGVSALRRGLPGPAITERGIIVLAARNLSSEEEVLETKMTEMLGIRYPIQCGTMHALTTAEVTALVAEAGCLCCLPAAYYETKQDLLDEVKKVRDQTDQPFGINVGLFPELRVTVTAEERIDWVIESGVKILETAGRSPEPQRKQIADADMGFVNHVGWWCPDPEAAAAEPAPPPSGLRPPGAPLGTKPRKKAR